MRGAFFILLILVCLSLLIVSLPCDIRDTVIIEGLDTSFHYRSNTIGELNVTIVKEWEALGETIHPFKSKDEMVVEIRPNPVDYIWCSPEIGGRVEGVSSYFFFFFNTYAASTLS